jgi:hypothetical protein
MSDVTPRRTVTIEHALKVMRDPATAARSYASGSAAPDLEGPFRRMLAAMADFVHEARVAHPDGYAHPYAAIQYLAQILPVPEDQDLVVAAFRAQVDAAERKAAEGGDDDE